MGPPCKGKEHTHDRCCHTDDDSLCGATAEDDPSGQAVCRLTIAINGMDYLVNPNRAEASAAFKAYRLSKADGTEYDAALTVHGLTCDCPDFIFRRDGIDPEGCKHIKAMVASACWTAKEWRDDLSDSSHRPAKA